MEQPKFTTPNSQKPANLYDDGNIPKEDLPQNTSSDESSKKDSDTKYNTN